MNVVEILMDYQIDLHFCMLNGVFRINANRLDCWDQNTLQQEGLGGAWESPAARKASPPMDSSGRSRLSRRTMGERILSNTPGSPISRFAQQVQHTQTRYSPSR